MRHLLRIGSVLLVVGAAPSWATIGDPPPPNPCLSGAKFRTNLAILDVSGDGAAPPACNGHNVETAITCTVTENPGVTVDFAIEYFDAAGALISPAVLTSVCAVLEGTTVSFTTRPLAPPYAGAFVVGTLPTTAGSPFCPAGTPGCFLHGSARILSTSRKIQCTATRLDLAGHCFGSGPPLPLSTKDLTILDRGRQVGD